MWTETLSLIMLSLQGSDSVKGVRLDYLEVQNITAVPYAVLVFCNNNKYFCSGTIVDPMWVLTSAHCVYDADGEFTEDDESITVVAGADSLYFSREDVETGKTQIRQSVSIKVHSSYSWYESFVNDLVIIKVKERFVMTDRVRVVSRSPGSDVGTKAFKYDAAMEPIKRQQDSWSCRGFGFGKVLIKVNSAVDFWLKAQDYEVDKLCLCLQRVRSVRVPHSILKKKGQFLCDIAYLRTGLCRGDNGGQLMCDGWLRGISTAVVHYNNLKECILEKDGKKSDCGSTSTLSFFTDLCSHNLWLREHIPGYPCVNESCNPDPDPFSGRSFY